MPDITVTPANVQGGANAVVQDGVAGVAIVAGQTVYLDAAANTWGLAQADGTTAEAGERGVGIARNAAAIGQPLKVQTNGQITIGGTVVVGQAYVVSAAAGGVGIHSELVSTNKVTLLGWGITATIIDLAPRYLGVAKP